MAPQIVEEGYRSEPVVTVEDVVAVEVARHEFGHNIHRRLLGLGSG
jgi:hypothetical protein